MPMPVITRLLTDTIVTLPVDAVAPIPKIAGAAGNATPRLPADIVAETPVDKNVSVEIFRSGKRIFVDVVLGELEQAEQSGVLQNNSSSDERTVIGFLGIAIASITKEMIDKYDLSEEKDGVVITEVIEGSPAFQLNIREGHIIRRVGQRKVETVETVTSEIERLREMGRSGVLMLIEANGKNRFVQLPFADR